PFLFQAEDGIRDFHVTGVQTCALPISGVLAFSANGNATFDVPRYDVKVDVQDLFFGEEGIGEVSGRLSVRDALLTFDVEAASPRDRKSVVEGRGGVFTGCAVTEEEVGA